MERELLRLEGVKCYFGHKRAVDGVDLSVYPGEVFGIVGESGSGKTTLGRCIMGLYPLTAGRIVFGGQPIRRAGGHSMAMRKMGKKSPADQMQMIFQDPLASLDPRMTVAESVAEGLAIRKIGDRKQREEMVAQMLELVGLRPEFARRYPHEFSGGQRQRIGIARALILHPQLLIADEPVSALDVSVQAQVINLLSDLRAQLDLTVLFVAHDLSVVKYFCDRIGVMYLGQLVEVAQTEELFSRPLHPYTQSLLSAVPLPDPRIQKGRQRQVYTPPEAAERAMIEVTQGHWVRCSAQERKQWDG